jgi:hypothetical protein
MMNGNEKLVWIQKPNGDVYLSSFESPVPRGFQRFSTTIPSEMDRVFAKIDRQEKRNYAEMTEATYNARKEFIDANLSSLNHKLANSDNEMEKAIIRAWIEAFNRKQTKLQTCTVYGVSAMQTTEANPNAPGDNRVTFIPPPERDSTYIENVPAGVN